MSPKGTSASAPLLSAVCLTLLGCADAGRYLRDRALDLSDIVDPKIGVGFGAGAKVEVSDYLGAGAGFGMSGAFEFYGRRLTRGGGLFLHLGVVGGDGIDDCGPGRVEVDRFLLQTRPDTRLPPLSRWRIGGEIFAPLASLGVYVNLGEIADFFAGLVGFDPAEDDGVAKGTWLESEAPTTQPTTRPSPQRDDVPPDEPSARQ